jgi:hypothetical protein
MEQPLQAQPVYWLGDPLTAELAITGGPTHECYRRLCATTCGKPPTCANNLQTLSHNVVHLAMSGNRTHNLSVGRN